VEVGVDEQRDGTMNIKGSAVLILGGAGLVGQAIARRLLEFKPRRIVLTSLYRAEAEEVVLALRKEEAGDTIIDAAWGDLFVPADYREWNRGDILADPEARAALVDDTYGDLTDEVLSRSALGSLLLDIRPTVVVDCINTAGALAYKNAFASAAELREAAAAGPVGLDEVEQLLATIYLPQLIRHVQLALAGMKKVGTEAYVKIGTAGTGGMGLNIPFTHSEERPSKVLLAKSGLAGAHTLLLYLMARTPGAPAVTEIKPTAAISWKALGYGPIRRGAGEIVRADATEALPLDEAFGPGADRAYTTLGEPLEGVWLDSGENGFFSLAEFETLTALGLMEFVTPEEIADNVLRELSGRPTGKDVVAALDGANLGSTYRGGVLRAAALQAMERLEREHGVEGVAYEMLGPPRLSKLLFEAQILRRSFPDLDSAAAMDPGAMATTAEALIQEDADLRQRILSVGIPILLADGASLLRGPRVNVPPHRDWPPTDPRLRENGWVDLRPENWERWKTRLNAFTFELAERPGAEMGSRADIDYGDGTGEIRPGRLAAWIFRYEDAGERIKR
jgi:NAD(P)-dependent dehydrogenase (short-subunit alcohol dehydrogenase family)